MACYLTCRQIFKHHQDMDNTVSREVYEAALETQGDLQHIIDELTDEVERLQNKNQKLKDAIILILKQK